MINILIDECTPCLKDSSTGEIIQTEVVRIRRKSFLHKYNKKNGWSINWEQLVDEEEIYALVLAGTVDIQGLIALHPSESEQAVFVSWMCAAPENNKLLVDEPRYVGVGGHLFAIAAEKSVAYGFGGAMTGYAANAILVEHYCSVFDAVHIGILHPYQFFIDEENASKIVEVYDYEAADDEL